MKLRAIGILAVGLGIGLGLAGPATAAAAPTEGIAKSRSEATGALTFLGTEPGATLPAPAGLAADAGPRKAALAYADAYGPRFGAEGGRDELSVASVSEPVGGGTAVRLQQELAGVPVIGGELVVNLDESGEARSISGEAEPDAPLNTEPDVSAGEAADAAIAAVAKGYDVDPSRLEASEPELSILDSRILGGPGLAEPTLVWQTEVSDRNEVKTIREFVAIDATLGGVAVNFSEIDRALARVICDAGSTTSKVPCTSPFARVEGQGPTGDVDTDLAYEYAGDTYNLFKGLGRDSLDGAGLPLVSTVHYCEAGSCPNYANAFWNGSQMVYGNGFPAADDVVGHELTHGVTDFSSHLFYYYQSGAINESMSDVFGEFVDLTNGAGTDTPAVRWQLGEDVPGFGAIRDMKNPPNFGDPDRTGSPLYKDYPDTGFDPATDSGGVHTNSGVNNKAAFLMTDGGTFNGQTVAGLGIGKVERIYYRVNTALLTSAADYQNLGVALRQACSDLATAGVGGITAANCAQVNKAVLATQMDTPPTNAPATDPPACTTPNTAPANVFLENFENQAAVFNRWAPRAIVGPPAWRYPPTTGPFDGTYATSGTKNMWGFDQGALSDSAVEMTTNVNVPAGGMLRFKHAYGFETFSGTRYDSGVLEYSVNNGASWQDAGPLINANGYTGAATTLGNTNPLAGRNAFVGDSRGYITTRANLAPLAGKSVRFRFRIGTDSTGADYGWFIDDVQVYSCRNVVPPDTKITKAKKKVKTKKRRAKAKIKFGGSDDATPADKLVFQCKLDKGGFKGCSSPAVFKVKATKKGKKHKVMVRAIDTAGNVDGSPDTATFKAVKKKKKRR